MSKVGAIFGIIGGSLMLIGGIIIMGYVATLESLINSAIAPYGYTLDDLGIDLTPLIQPANMRAIITIVLGVIGIVGGIVGMVRVKIGGIICLLIGIIATVGMFLPIYSTVLDFGSGTIRGTIPVIFTLNTSFLYIDPILILIGGIIGVASKGDKLPKESSEKKEKKTKDLDDYARKKYDKKLDKETKKELKKAKKSMGL